MVSIGDKEILPLMKCVKILNQELPSFITFRDPKPIALSFVSSTFGAYISASNHLLGILAT